MTAPIQPRFRPSGAARALSCSASLLAEAPYPDTSSAYAEEGTKAHTVAEDFLVNGVPDRKLNEMETYAAEYVQMIERTSPQGYTVHVESQVNVGRALELITNKKLERPQYGTTDTWVYGYDTLHVYDLKYGMGHVISPKDNEQLYTYAMGLLATRPECKKARFVHFYIFQPRIGGLSVHVIEVTDLAKWANKRKKQFTEIVDVLNGDSQGTFSPSEEACHWCKHAGNCAAQANKQREMFNGFD